MPREETQFKPGESGNPGGKPKGVPNVWTAIERLMRLSPDEFAEYKPRNMGEQVAMARLRAATLTDGGTRDGHYIVDRQNGKTPETIKHEGAGLRVVLKRREEPQEGADDE